MKRGFFLACLALAGLAAPAWAQATREVTGVVRMTGTGQPLPDVTVSLAGGTASARTNDQGQYRIRVPVADVTLIARSIGYKRQSRMVPMGQGSADFSLEKDVLLLERVTVTGQATTLSSRNATTAVAGVDGNDVVRSPGQDVVQQLQGKVVGASINMNSGAPGGAGQIQIRGVTSVLGAGQPLIVVDGIIISNESFSSGANAVTGASGGGMPSSQDAMVNRLSDLNPQEIESVEVLKSAAATALYGSRATNGVVVIKTKKGLPGAPRFNLTQRVGTQNQLRRLGTRRFTDVQQVVDLPYGNGESGKAWM
ncbi:MAG TPA: TonB-dependent receptor plug domain-containing protein, partial [Gemmatimonadaceae bacterium]|nr:TonB-dependent receptor plug domain-containing protein [Gemmatimonadaceae bacterium]